MRARDNAASRVQRVLALRTFPGFAHLAPRDLAVLAEVLRPRFFPAGVTILKEGVPAPGLQLIVDGKVTVHRKGRVPRTFASKDVVGGISSLTREPVAGRFVADEDTITLELDRDDMEEVFEDNFTIVLAVLRAFANYHLSLRKELGVDCGYAPVDESTAFPEVGELWLVERMRILNKTLPFGNVSVEAVASIAQSSEELRLEPGQTLWREGDPSGYNVTVLSGILECETDDKKHHFRFGAGSVLGAIDSIAQTPRWYTARAETPVVALRAYAEALVDFMEDHSNLAMEMLRLNARMVNALHERLSEMASTASKKAAVPMEMPSSPSAAAP